MADNGTDAPTLEFLRLQFIADCKHQGVTLTLDSMNQCDECMQQVPLRDLTPHYHAHYGCVLLTCTKGCNGGTK